MLILEAHSWSFLSIFRAEWNLLDACKVYELFVCYKDCFNVGKIFIEKTDFLVETILCVVVFS